VLLHAGLSNALNYLRHYLIDLPQPHNRLLLSHELAAQTLTCLQALSALPELEPAFREQADPLLDLLLGFSLMRHDSQSEEDGLNFEYGIITG
jgi:hypothetical protein